MPATSNLAEQKNLGYVLHPPRRPSEPGYACLDALIAPQPSGRHFDPYFLRLWVATHFGEQAEHPGVDCQTIEYPWNGESRLHVCAGQVDLIDRYGKHLDAFTFGGELWLETSDEHTAISLRSPAPILLMHGMHTESKHAPVATLLAQESEILLAQRRAFWEQAAGEFDQRLVMVEPMALYLASLQAIQERFAGLPPSPDAVMQQFRRMLRLEIEAVQASAPQAGLGSLLLEEIL